MGISTRAAARMFRPFVLGVSALALAVTPAFSAGPIDKALPDSTILFVRVTNAAAFRESLRQSSTGQLIADPAMKPLVDDFLGKLEGQSSELKAKLGVSISELLELPQGPINVSLIARPDAKVPVALLIAADAGKNKETVQGVLTKATAQAEEKGAKVATEEFKGVTINLVKPPRKDDNAPDVTFAWANTGTTFNITSDVDALKEFLTNAEGREDSLFSNESYQAVLKRVGAESQVLWFLDANKALQLALAAAAKGDGGANVQQVEAVLQLLGLKGLKAIGGGTTYGVGGYDTLTKTYFYTPGPAQGVLKVFNTPKADLRPQAWVPATVATYQSLSWDLDAAWSAVNELANTFQPGILQVVQQQLVGPDGQTLDFQKDLFGPIGDRITAISDFKKPTGGEDTQRSLFAVALEDTKAFEATLGKIIAITNAQPKKREFQGTTIYDFTLPEMPNAANNPFKGPLSVAIAKDNAYIATDPSLLEQVLRGGPGLADTAEFQAVAKSIPEQTTTLTYTKPEEAARQSYEMIKSGQLEKAFGGAAAAGGPDLKELGKLIDKEKLPDFSVFAKYLSQGGGFGTSDEDGALFTTFILRKTNP
ncbi:hypothetical protein EP7_003627 [Isosphaeraceae bacterium EP7]